MMRKSFISPPSGEFSQRLAGLSKSTLHSISEKMSDNSNNMTSNHLLWFNNHVELFSFQGHEGFMLQGYHIPSILSNMGTSLSPPYFLSSSLHPFLNEIGGGGFLWNPI